MKTQADTCAYTITGRDAIRIAKRDKLTLRKYADPLEDSREVTQAEAEDIAKEDESLIYIEVEPIGWIAEICTEGYTYGEYWDDRGNYLGPDDYGVEPVFCDA